MRRIDLKNFKVASSEVARDINRVILLSLIRSCQPVSRAELARLSGPEGKEGVVAQRYLAAQGRLVEAGLRLTAMRLDARGAWEFDLSNGVTVRLGRREVDERFDTFMRAALKLIAQRPDDIAYVDMRYTNGFAVGWRETAAHHKNNEGHGQNV